jgi:TRAP transporter 4TM/12TM fusion protein
MAIAQAAGVTVRRGQRLAEAAIGGTISLISIAWVLSVPQRLHWSVATESFVTLILALALAGAYLTTSRGRCLRGRAAGYDIALAAIAASLCVYIALFYPSIQGSVAYKPLHLVIAGTALLLVLGESIRRTCGPAMLIIVLCFVAYALLGHLVPGRLGSRAVDWDRLFLYLAFDTNALIGTSLIVACEVVVPFIFLGQILMRGGGADYFNDLALAMAGRSRGGAGKIAVVSSLFFGTVSGSAVANVLAGGTITIPMMVRSGMSPHRAAAVEAVSSTGGQLVPPVMGAAAFLMAEYLQIKYRDVALAAIAPSLLFYFALWMWCDLRAGRDRLRLVDVSELPRARHVLRWGWYLPAAFALLFLGLFWLNWSAQAAAMLTCGALLLFGMVFGYRGRRMSPRDVFWCLTSCGIACVEIIVICGAAGLVIGVLAQTGLSFSLTNYLSHLASANVLLLLAVTAAICMVLGMGMPTVGVYVLVAPLMGPALKAAGLDPVASHMFLLYFGMLSMITPPVAVASFTAASIAKTDFWKTGWEGVRVGWICYVVPFVFVFQPAILFRGDALAALWELACAAVGVVAATAALVGYLSRDIGPAWRLGHAAAAILLFLPLEALFRSWIVNASGLVLFAGILVAERRARRATLA